jgi:hypothetical protein
MGEGRKKIQSRLIYISQFNFFMSRTFYYVKEKPAGACTPPSMRLQVELVIITRIKKLLLLKTRSWVV